MVMLFRKTKTKLIAGFFLIFVMSLLSLPLKAKAQEAKIHVLDVGEGLAVLLESDGEYMMYDGGGRDHSSKVVAYLKQQGVDEIHQIVASHYDEDHIAGLIGVLRTTQVDHVYGPDYTVDTATYASFMRALRDNGLSVTTPSQADTFALGSCEVTVLSKANVVALNENDYSVVLRVVCGDTAIILTGDATAESEQEILNSGLELKSQILVAGHHGSSSSTSEAFLQAVSPDTVVISVGSDNTYGHPTKKVMNRLEQANIHVLRTDDQGDLTIYSDGTNWSMDPEPCDDYSYRTYTENDGFMPLVPAADGEEAEAEQRSMDIIDEYRYVLNTNTMKFHLPGCSSVNQMKPKNTAYSSESRDELIAQGYDPCGNCHP